MFTLVGTVAWCRHFRTELTDGSLPCQYPLGLAVIKRRAVVERPGISLIELASLRTISGCRWHGAPPQRKSPQHVVGKREPQQHGAGLVFAAHQQPAEPHAARPGMGAFGGCALFVEGFAGLAGHALAPVRHPGLVVGPRRVGIGAMFAVHRRAPQSDAVGVGPFDVVVLGEPAIDQEIRRPPGGGVQAFQRRARQAAIGARGVDVDRDDDLTPGRRDDLHVVGRPKPAIGGRGARLLLPADLGLVGLRATRALGVEFGAQLLDPRRGAAASSTSRSRRRNEPAPAAARTLSPSCASTSRATTPWATSAAPPPASKRSSTAACATRKSLKL